MKNLLLAILVLFLNTTIFLQLKAQKTPTKKETEDWILSKLRSYTPEKFSVGHKINENDILPAYFTNYGNFSFSFDQYYLIVKHDYYENNGSYNSTRIYRIPVYDISRVYEYEKALWITTKTNSILTSETLKNSKTTTTVLSFEFQFSAETDLEQRIQKAFLNLKKYYNKPQSTEAF